MVVKLSTTRRHFHSVQFEALEQRALLSATLFVYSGPADATHFQTLQAALAVAVTGDTILMQSGFQLGNFATTTLSAPAAAGTTSIRTAAALETGQVVSIGSLSGGDPLESALVTGVSTTGAGDYLITLASPLLYSHVASKVDATNASTIGKFIGINKAITLTADAGVTLPVGVNIWTGTTGATVSNFTLANLTIDGDGNSISNVTVSNQLSLNNAHNNSLTGLHVNTRLRIGTGSSGNTVSNSVLASLRLDSGSHHNTFSGNTIGTTTAVGVTDASGHDTFQNNTFIARVTINGATNVPTADSFLNNTFTVSSGDALVLEHAHGTLVQGNTFTDSSAFCNALVVHNSAAILITGNTITTTGAMGTGIYVYSDGTAATSVDVTNNIIHTTDGWALYVAKYDVTASLEMRVQANDLRNNAVGLFAYGDGVTAGNIDLGGGVTTFGASTGMNDFSTYTSADSSHYAIGVMGTDDTFLLLAKNNLFGVAEPMTVIADGSHTPQAFGSGVVVATAYVPPPPPPVIKESLAAGASNLEAIETGTSAGVIATFTSNFTHNAGDFLVTIDWGDGVTTLGTVVANANGGWNVLGAHTWNDAGTFTVKVSIATSQASTEASSTATITARMIALEAVSFSIDKKQPFSGIVANFTDNLPGTTASSYIASIAWSDGMVTAATIVKNSDGSFSIKTSRSFTTTGVMIASVSISTVDGLYSGVASLTATITNKNDKVPGPKEKAFKQLVRLVKSVYRQTPVHRSPASLSHCHR